MLSRNASGIYWMGRYLERTELLCRLMRKQVETLVDRPLREIVFGWRRLYGGLNTVPPDGDELELQSDEDLARHLTVDKTNQDSVFSCFEKGRENARQMHHCISSEMWLCLNTAYQRFQRFEFDQSWNGSPEMIYIETAQNINTFIGVAETTMYRDENWHFMQLGRFIERTQATAAMLLSQIRAARRHRMIFEADWVSLLRVYQAHDAYTYQYGIKFEPDNVINLLVTDPFLPRSLFRSIKAAHGQLTVLSPGPIVQLSDLADRVAGRITMLLRYEWPDSDEPEQLIETVYEHALHLHNCIIDAYIDYPLEDV